MYKIKKIKFKNHQILGDLELDFTDRNGKAVDTVIIAGENGVGKSMILNALYSFASCNPKDVAQIVLAKDGNKEIILDYYINNQFGAGDIWVKDNEGFKSIPGSKKFTERYSFNGIYSDVDITFDAASINSVTSMQLDEVGNSRKSTKNLPQQINQLLVDIQNIDDSDLSKAYREAKENGADTNTIEIPQRMYRFTKAFANMFDDLKYYRIINERGCKRIQFKKGNAVIPIDMLSSGEKQIVYRGCFLLKDVNAMNGAFVFIDEPEISMHPNWQSRIMNYYKGIFSDSEGKQTSQIFVVTHSPFIIHNENRKNDKVLVIARDSEGKIGVKDKPEYYSCKNIEAVQDAFSISDFTNDTNTVYLEGRTDEKYFNKAIEVYGYKNNCEYKWIGHIDERGQEANTGAGALDKAKQFLIGKPINNKVVLLYDCDTKKEDHRDGNIFTRSLPFFNNEKGMKIGIENALVLDNIDTGSFYSTKTKEGGYGEKNTITVFEKMKFCDYICGLDNAILEKVFMNIKDVIEELDLLFEED